MHTNRWQLIGGSNKCLHSRLMCSTSVEKDVLHPPHTLHAGQGAKGKREGAEIGEITHIIMEYL